MLNQLKDVVVKPSKSVYKGGYVVVKSILSSPPEMVLETALSAASMRHKVLSNNIANVNTPGFKRSDVLFEDKLAAALEQSSAQLTQTNEMHMPGSQMEFMPAIVTENNTSVRSDGNNVDIDSEMANVAENDLYYQSVATVLTKYFSMLSSAIKEGKSS
jgi:flagellar basal-body rod protein FlgB